MNAVQYLSITPPLLIANLQIRCDSAGRYCLNDLHQAAGSQRRHQPANWVRTSQAQELIAELSRNQPYFEGGVPSPEVGLLRSEQGLPKCEEGVLISEEAPLSVQNDGLGNGTYAVKPLIYAYAMWISPRFHLQVIAAYDALVATPAQPAAPTHAPAALHTARAQIVSRLFRATKAGEIQALHAQVAKLSEELGLPVPEMPVSPTARTDALLAEFWQAVDAGLASGKLHNHARNPAWLALNLPEVRLAARDLGVALPETSGLTMLLRGSGRLLHAGQAVNSLYRGRTIKCWVFSL